MTTVLAGQGGDDQLFGGDGRDELQGGDGNDYMDGEEGADTVFAGDGEDELYGGSGDDRLLGEGGADYIDGEEGADSLFGDSGDDTLVGGRVPRTALYGDADADGLYGGDGDDLLEGGEGDDLLSGGTGNDTLVGGAGNDVYSFAAGDGFDTLIDAEGTNTIRFTGTWSPTSLKIVQSASDAGFRVKHGFDGDAVVLSGGLAESVQHFEFADGTVKTLQEVLDLADADPIVLAGAGLRSVALRRLQQRYAHGRCVFPGRRRPRRRHADERGRLRHVRLLCRRWPRRRAGRRRMSPSSSMKA